MRKIQKTASITAVFLVLAWQGQVIGQSAKSTARTPWGDPDLQGIWSYGVFTPLERPSNLSGKEFVTDEEAANLNEDAAKLQDRPVRPGDTGAYNQFWMDIRKVNRNRRTSLIVEPADGRLPFRPEIAAKRAQRAEFLRQNPADSWVDRSLQERCLVYHGIPPVPSNYNNNWQIFQTKGAVIILAENIHNVRYIPLDGRPHLSSAIRQWHGDSRGHWEGQTLVVETTNFRDRSAFQSAAATGFTSDKTRATERFTRTDRDTIDYEYVIDDPALFTRPWKVSMPFERTNDKVVYEYACHEGNRGMEGILSGARAEEKGSR